MTSREARPLIADASADGTPAVVGTIARTAEERGVSRLTIPELARDPFVMLAGIAGQTSRLELATGVAIAFARTPMTLAYEAWTLSEVSEGRAVIGLGSQVKPHIERRFAMTWDRPAARMREFVLATRAIWSAWQDRTRLNFRGDFYQHTLMPPMFSPPPLPSGPPPLLLAGVGPLMTKTAGAVADGFLTHPFGSPSYLRERVLPGALEARAESEAAGEPWTTRPFEVSADVLVATGRTDEEIASAIEATKARIAFYASTPTYRGVLEHHGWGDLHEELHQLSVTNGWDKMPALITDEQLHTYAVVGEPDTVARELIARYGGWADRVTINDTRAESLDVAFDVIAAVADQAG